MMRLSHFWRQVSGQFGGWIATKGLDFAIVVAASRLLSVEAVGVVLFARAAAAVLLPAVDFGLYPVVFRRTARNAVSLRLLLRAHLLRGVGGILLALVFGVGAFFTYRQEWLPIVGFFVAEVVWRVHEISRAALVGRERFVLNAALAVVSRSIATALTIGSLLMGLGILGWMAGRLFGEVLHLIVLAVVVVREVPREPAEIEERHLISEGLPLWISRVLTMLGNHLSILLLSTWYGFEDGGFIGIANRISSGALLVVRAIATVAFPGLARDRNSRVERRHVIFVGVLALVTSLLVFAVAPLAIWVFTGDAHAEATAAIRVLALAVFLEGIAKPADTWAFAKDRERALMWANGLAQAATVVTTVPLVGAFGLWGAAWALVLRSAFKLLGILAVVIQTHRRVQAEPSAS